MKITRWGRFVALLAAVLMVGALLAISCGGGDDDGLNLGDDKSSSQNQDNGDSQSDNGEDEDADEEADEDADEQADEDSDADEEDSDSDEVSGDAEDYTSDVCKAISKYSGDIEEISDADFDFEDTGALKDMMEQAAPLLEDIAADMEDIDPPSEIQDWHDQMVDAMYLAAELFGKMADALDKPLDEAMVELEQLSTEMGGVDNPFGSMLDLPPEYQTAFENNPDCEELQNLDFFE